MPTDNVSLIVMAIILGTGGAIGYITRIFQKVQDRRDTIYLTQLPILYHSLTLFLEAMKAYKTDTTASIEDLFAKTQSANDELNKVVSAAEIIMFKEDLHKAILEKYADMQSLQSIIGNVKDSTEPVIKDIFRDSLVSGKIFEGRNFSEVIDSISKLRDNTITEMHKYRSFSWILLILIIVSAIIVGLVDVLLQDSGYFKELTQGVFNSTSNLTTTNLTT
jgi:hypothetical protein